MTIEVLLGIIFLIAILGVIWWMAKGVIGASGISIPPVIYYLAIGVAIILVIVLIAQLAGINIPVLKKA